MVCDHIFKVYGFTFDVYEMTFDVYAHTFVLISPLMFMEGSLMCI